jgi:hypothetical protein
MTQYNIVIDGVWVCSVIIRTHKEYVRLVSMTGRESVIKGD